MDADHSYDSVRNDVAAWRSKVRPGGILCGHDCEGRVTHENRRLLNENQHADTIPGIGTPFAVIHPGSVLAIDAAFGGAAGHWAESTVTLADGTPGLSTIWFVPTKPLEPLLDRPTMASFSTGSKRRLHPTSGPTHLALISQSFGHHGIARPSALRLCVYN